MKSPHARAVLLLTAVIFALAVARNAPRGSHRSLADDQFSGRRAYTLLGKLYQGIGAHPTGSRSNAVLRERISLTLQRLGYAPRIQRDFVCSRWGSCATVENIVTEIPGRESGKSVLLVSHYDSVPAGPGIADDGSAVAITLEIARILQLGDGTRNPIVLLFTDGEEGGLLGAEAFVAHDPAAKNVGAVVNLEARGTSGASYMFETSRDNAWVVALFARAVVRPATSSLFYTIYQHLPNDTDFSVFKRAGMQGTNFAFIGDALHYHTPLDDLLHLSEATLEMQGANALAMTRAFGQASLTDLPAGDATYFDFLQFLVLAWPASLSIWIAVALLVLFPAKMFLLARRGVLAIGSSAAAAGASFAAAVVAGLIGYGATLLLQATGAFPDTWVARPGAAIAFFCVVGMLAASVPALVWLHRDQAASFWAGSGFLFCVLSVVSAATLPGISFLFILPAAAYFVISSLWLAKTGGASAMRWLAPVIGVAATLVPVAALLYDGMGLVAMPGVSLLASLATTTFAIPLLTASPLRGRTLLVLGSLAVAALLVASVLPPWSPDAPRPLNFVYELRPDGSARWLSSADEGPLPDPVARAAHWERGEVVPFPERKRASYFQAAAPPIPLRPLGIESAAAPPAGGKRAVRLVVRDITAGTRVAIVMLDRRTIESVTVDGVKVPFDDRRRGREWTTVTLLASGKEDSELVIVTSSPAPIETIVRHLIPSLPPAGAALLKSRPPDATPVQSGDMTLVTRRLQL